MHLCVIQSSSPAGPCVFAASAMAPSPAVAGQGSCPHQTPPARYLSHLASSSNNSSNSSSSSSSADNCVSRLLIKLKVQPSDWSDQTKALIHLVDQWLTQGTEQQAHPSHTGCAHTFPLVMLPNFSMDFMLQATTPCGDIVTMGQGWQH